MAAQKPLVAVADAWTVPAVATFPRYDRAALGCGIAHLGVGNFHRAHQALFLHDYLQTHPENWISRAFGDDGGSQAVAAPWRSLSPSTRLSWITKSAGDPENWMIHGIGPLPTDIDLVRAMNAQGNLYTLTERSGTEDRIKVIGAIKHFSHAPADPPGVIRLLASDSIKIISLTITEKGYCYNAARDLDVDHPAIQADLASDAVPRSALGYLFAAAQQRMTCNGPPVTILSCDNLPTNGNLLRRLLLQFADLKAPAVGGWIRENVAFPSSMVDRITPAVTDATRAFVRETFGVDDRCPVVSEAYLQWVLEDRFLNGRPALETAGVQFVASVEPYELLKIRMLNGSHSALSYVAYLMGFREVDTAMRDPLVRGFVQRYMDDDITPTLPTVPGVDVTAYKATLIERFTNAAMRDQVQRLAMDGSQKIHNAIVPPLEQQLAAGGSIRWIAFALAAWYRYLRGVDESGAPIEIDDPLKDELTARAQSAPDDPRQLLAVQSIFGDRLAANPQLVAAVKESLDAIDSLGTRQALSRLMGP